MLKKILLTLSVFLLFSVASLAEKVIVFEFTDTELKTLKVKKVKGKTTWSLGSNENGSFIRAEAEGKGSGLGKEITIDVSHSIMFVHTS